MGKNIMKPRKKPKIKALRAKNQNLIIQMEHLAYTNTALRSENKGLRTIISALRTALGHLIKLPPATDL